MSWLTAVAGVLVVLTSAATAEGYYGRGASIVSASYERLEQADAVSRFGDVSGDGRYVVFQTRARNLFSDLDPDPPGRFRVGGIFRHDLTSGRIELVADGDIHSESAPDELEIRGAENPSVSADGRYVAFSTGQQLALGDNNGNNDVYVRDMNVPLGLDRKTSGAYELVSARDGTDTAASYEPADPPQPGRELGSEVTPGAAISADGRTVVFRTRRTSDLPARPTADTPDRQLLVRRLGPATTTLVTTDRTSGAPAGGARGPSGISADGSTVVWTGTNAAALTELLPGETTDTFLPYYLWRRVASGLSPTRRITGLADPEDPGCPDSGSVSQSETDTGPCYGPLTSQEQGLGADISGLLPAVSADGNRVAFLTGAGPRPNSNTGAGLDLYVVDMNAPSRKAGTTELTREGAIADQAASSQLEDLTASPDGRYLAIATRRTTFLLPALTFLGTRRTFPDVRELYVVDLQQKTIERVLRSVFDGEIDRDVNTGLSLSDDATRVAFSSSATNLFVGDANEQTDVFVASRSPAPAPEAAAPPDAPGADFLEDLGAPERPRLRVSARALPDGSLVLTVRVPGSGSLKATARARLERRRTTRVADASARTAKAATKRVRLRPSQSLRRELRRRRRVPARVKVVFTARRGGKSLTGSVRTAFRLKPQRRPDNG